MAGNRDQIARRILREFRHLMTESERRADRAFTFQSRSQNDPISRDSKEMSTAVDDALSEPAARQLFEKGRTQFLEDMVQRILAEHGPELPRCEACGHVLKQPSPKDCFDCNY